MGIDYALLKDWMIPTSGWKIIIDSKMSNAMFWILAVRN